jgi:hypothetical protein
MARMEQYTARAELQIHDSFFSQDDLKPDLVPRWVRVRG